MKNTQNHVTLAYCPLGSKSMLAEETKFRANIDHATLPDNDQIMAYPYPSSYGISRFINMSVINETDNDKLVTRYSVAFCHRCLLWQHSRVYNLSADEYHDLLLALADKYSAYSALFVSDASDHSNFSSHNLYWYISDIEI